MKKPFKFLDFYIGLTFLLTRVDLVSFLYFLLYEINAFVLLNLLYNYKYTNYSY